MEKGQLFQQMMLVLEELNVHIQKKKKKSNLSTDLMAYTKTNSKWILDINVNFIIINIKKKTSEKNCATLGSPTHI